MLKKAKRILCNALAVIGVVACAGTMGACETQEPKVKMQVEFNGKTYTLEYTMYRKITPTTVKHFLTLVEKNFYDGMCIHDYQSGVSMETGAYKYDVANATLEYQDYYTTVKNYLPQSVWLDEEKTKPTYTLYGEFEDNDFKVTNGALMERFGALVMSYEDSGNNADVYVERNNGKGIARRDYQENSATSKFYISLSTTVKKNKSHCVFAMLSEKSEKQLKALESAISTYIAKEYDSADDFTSQKYGELYDNITGESEKAYDVPNEPITIKDISVVRY